MFLERVPRIFVSFQSQSSTLQRPSSSLFLIYLLKLSCKKDFKVVVVVAVVVRTPEKKFVEKFSGAPFDKQSSGFFAAMTDLNLNLLKTVLN